VKTGHQRPRASTKILCLIVGAALLAACGGDDDSASTTVSGSQAPASTDVAVVPTTAGETGRTITTDAATEGASESSTAPPTAPPTTAAQVDFDPTATLRIALPQAPSTWDPATTANGAVFMFFARSVYDSLLRDVNTATGTAFAPSLATAWTVAPDGLSVEFKLRSDVVFQDGTTFDASAVKANIERNMTLQNSTAAPRLANVKSVDVLDPQTVTFTLAAPDASFLYTLADDPAGLMVSPAAFGTDLETTPVGSGPYTLASVDGGTTTYERFEDYWDVADVRASKVEIQTVTDSNAALNSLQTGLVDVVRMSPLDYTKGQELADSGDYQLHLTYNSQPFLLFLNNAHKPFDDVTVRRAVSLALDRDSISKAVLPFNAPTAQIYQAGFVGHDEALDTDIPFDTSQATSLVQAAGASGSEISILYPSIDPYPVLAQIVQASLQEIGINSTLVAKPPAETSGDWLSGGYDMFVGTWSGSPSPQTQANIHLVQTNVGQGVDATANSLVATAAALDQASPEAASAWKAVGAYLVENPMTVPILRSAGGWLGTSSVVGLADLQQPSGSLDLSVVGIGS
jgi:peptide/nickel transport system substrate-binding protein